MTPSISRHFGILTALSLFLWAAAPPAAAQAADYNYESNNGTITITGYTGPGGAVTIPDTINGLPVTSIGEWAFDGCTSLTSVTIPNSVTSIGWYAFSGCSSLTSVTIPNSVTSIGWYAFSGCSSLTNVAIPHSVTSIGDWAFSGCSSLTNVTIPNSVTSIGDGAFWDCTSLTSITIPDRLLNVGLNLQYLGQSVGATGWRAIKVNESMVITGYNCSNNVVTIPDTINGLPVTGIDGAFDSCTSLTNVTIPNGVTRIGWYAFSDCTSLTSVTIPDSVTSIGLWAFVDCTSLTSITIPDSLLNAGLDLGGLGQPVATSGWRAIKVNESMVITGYHCSNNVVSIPDTMNGLPVIGIDGAFSGCTSLTSITIPNSVTHIGGGAFGGCTSLVSITIPDSVTSIGFAAFYGCTGLTNITIPHSVTSIGDGAFSGCTSLTSASIPNGVTHIGASWLSQGAFSGCTSLTSVTIPNSVTNIEGTAFYDCTSLTAAYFQGNAPSLDGRDPVFGDGTYATVYYLPGATGWGSTFGGLPTARWSLPSPVVLNHGSSFGPQTNSFGFTISWATNLSVVVEASTSLANPVWSPVATNTLTGGSSYFSDPQWTNYPSRFYRLRSP